MDRQNQKKKIKKTLKTTANSNKTKDQKFCIELLLHRITKNTVPLRDQYSYLTDQEFNHFMRILNQHENQVEINKKPKKVNKLFPKKTLPKNFLYFRKSI